MPVIAAPMFLVSSPELVVECCKAGIIGSFPSLNARTVDVLDDWMTHIAEELRKAREDQSDRRIAPWAVNLIVHRTNPRYEADLELIRKHRPPVVITSLGNPAPVVDVVHGYGGLVFSDVSTLVHARKAAGSGVDGLILVCSGAGGACRKDQSLRLCRGGSPLLGRNPYPGRLSLQRSGCFRRPGDGGRSGLHGDPVHPLRRKFCE